MLTILEDALMNGPFLLTNHGGGLALGFRGTTEYITRCFNWALNTGVINRNAHLCWAAETGVGRVGYVCPRSKEALHEGIRLQIRAEIVAAKEVPYLEDHTREDDWEGDPDNLIVQNDAIIDQLAEERSKTFIKDQIVTTPFLSRLSSSEMIDHAIASPGRAESEDWN